MPRPLRIEYPGAIYHVISRGDRRELIFLEDGDRHSFLKTLGESWAKTGCEIHACVLMGNLSLRRGSPAAPFSASACNGCWEQ